ncbi:MAG TPA: hypothetical protein VKE22_16160 [Haliangiales bacterium]|nr:hypothetical protein [Haliangiales bacterium]
MRAVALAVLLSCGGAAARIRSQIGDVDVKLDLARDAVRRAELAVAKAGPKEADGARRDMLAAVSEKAYLDAEKAYLEQQLATLADPSPENRAKEDTTRARRDHLETEWRERVKEARAP